jgi:hypothetical protein
LYNARDALQTEPAVVLGVEGFVGVGEGLEVVTEDAREGILPAGDIPGGGCVDNRGVEHTPENSRKLIDA